MKLLMCGAGTIARDLLNRLGQGWEATLIDKSAEELAKSVALVPEVEGYHAADASSPVVLDKVGVGGFDYVLALTDSDAVNTAVAEYAVEKGAAHVSALVRNPENRKRMSELGVHVIQSTNLVAAHLYHYLQDPRIRVSPLNLGPGAFMEVKASDHVRVAGKPASYFNSRKTRLVGLFRDGKLIFPAEETPIEPDDSLLLLGEPTIFESVCDLLECGGPHFPLAHGPGMLVASSHGGDALNALLDEGLYLARNTRVRSVTLLAPKGETDLAEETERWPQAMEVSLLELDEDMIESVRQACGQGNYGLVVIPPVEKSFLRGLTSPTLVSLAREIGVPLLISRGGFPFKRILVPFSATPMAENALEIAVDISLQAGGEVSLAVVEEPRFIANGEEGWKEGVLKRIRELGHIHKTRFEPLLRKGNPVKEVEGLSRDFDLMVIGSTNRGKGFLSPNIGEELAGRAKCSVLITAS